MAPPLKEPTGPTLLLTETSMTETTPGLVVDVATISHLPSRFVFDGGLLALLLLALLQPLRMTPRIATRTLIRADKSDFTVFSILNFPRNLGLSADVKCSTSSQVM